MVFNKYKVKQVINITDVGHLVSDADAGEDKMMKALVREGLEPTAKSLLKIADKYTRAFHSDFKKLNLTEPAKWPKATKHIPEMIKIIETLLKKGFAYETSAAIYYDISKFKNYGKLAKISLEQLEAGARVEVDQEKKNPLDFVLWFKGVGKHAKHIMQWDSPFSRGFPGWHIECSAMATKYLGKQFDIHTGGMDHIPIHHTNEIAQSEAAFNVKPWVKYWMHNGFLELSKGEKMAKSGENFVTLSVLEEKGFDALVYKYFCLGTSYRKPLMFSWEALEGAQNSFSKLKERVLDLKESNQKNIEKNQGKNKIEKYQKQFLSAVNDDLNTPQALAVVWDVLKDEKLGVKEKYDLVINFDKVLGLGLKDLRKDNIPKEILDLVKERETARNEKDWSKADKLRDKISEKGYSIEDEKEGVNVKKNNSNQIKIKKK